MHSANPLVVTQEAAGRLELAAGDAGALNVRNLPGGTVTLLFTEIEGSTRLLRQLGDRYAILLADYRHLVRSAFQSAGGCEVDTQGDAFFVAFPCAAVLSPAPLRSSVRWQLTLAQGACSAYPYGAATGEPRLTREGYVGLDLHHGARPCKGAPTRLDSPKPTFHYISSSRTTRNTICESLTFIGSSLRRMALVAFTYGGTIRSSGLGGQVGV